MVWPWPSSISERVSSRVREARTSRCAAAPSTWRGRAVEIQLGGMRAASTGSSGTRSRSMLPSAVRRSARSSSSRALPEVAAGGTCAPSGASTFAQVTAVTSRPSTSTGVSTGTRV